MRYLLQNKVLMQLLVFAFFWVGPVSGWIGGYTFDMRGVPAPYNFYKFQELSTGERIGVGGGGHFEYQATSEKEFRTKVSDADLNGVHFVNPDEGWVVGTKGSIYRTENRGRSWMQQESGVSSELLAITCAGRARCWITGNNGLILTTRNGQEWTRLESGVKEHLTAVDFLDEKVGVIIGEKATILRTDDGGASWRRQSITGGEEDCNGHPFSSAGSPASLYGVKIFDADNAWIAAGLGVVKYSTSTDTWEGRCLKDAGPLAGIATNDGINVFGIGFFGENVVSKDSGNTWNVFKPEGR